MFAGFIVDGSCILASIIVKRDLRSTAGLAIEKNTMQIAVPVQ